MTRAALITGIGGQDGSYLAERLVAEGRQLPPAAAADLRKALPGCRIELVK